ncbi:MAG: hypothetical protein RL172_187 [Bacteroidota bacterium]
MANQNHLPVYKNNFILNNCIPPAAKLNIAMLYTNVIDATIIQQWIAGRMQPAAIREQLQQQGLDEASIDACLREYKKLRNAKRQTAGFFFTALGAVTGFISCLLTILNPFPDLYNVILFGLTSVAILLICYGLYCIFE